jgi:hypothetical protein
VSLFDLSCFGERLIAQCKMSLKERVHLLWVTVEIHGTFGWTATNVFHSPGLI